MALKPAICTQCGGQIEVDDSKEAGICQFCGTAFITEKVIHQYVTQNNFAGATINIQGGVDDENLYMLARRAVEQNNVADILKYYGQLVERNPNDWEAVFYSSFFKGDDAIVLPNLELALNLLFDSVVITKKGNYEEIFNKVDKIISLFERKYGKNSTYSDEISLKSFQDILLKLLDNQIIHNNNKLNWNLCLILNLILVIELEFENYFEYYYHLRTALRKLFELNFDDRLSEEDINSIKNYLLRWFDWFIEVHVFLNLDAYDIFIRTCPYIDQKEKNERKLFCYKNFYKKFQTHPQFKNIEKELISRIKTLESELPPKEREFTNKLKKEKKDKRMGCLCFLLVILLIGGFFFYGFLNQAEMSIKEFFHELLKLIKGE